MTFPFPQNNWNIDQRPIIYRRNWLMFALGTISGSLLSVLAVHFIIDSHRFGICSDDNPTFKCYIAKGEILVKLKKDLTVDPICTTLQKNYLGCLPEILWTSAFPEQALANKRAEKAKRQKPPSRSTSGDELPEECVGDNCPPW